MSSGMPIEKELAKYQKKGYVLERPKQLKCGSTRYTLTKKRGFGLLTDHVYYYHADGKITDDCITEFFKDYCKCFSNDSDRGYFVSASQVDKKRFEELKILTIADEDENIRDSTKLLVIETIETKKEQLAQESNGIKQPEIEQKIDGQDYSKDIFIVHGRDHSAVKDLQFVLLQLGFHPKVLQEQASGSRTIIEQLEKHSKVGYAFVILTPDDVGMEKAVFQKIANKPDEIKKGIHDRARQNVILEFGYFIGLLTRNRVCCLHKGDIERPSDMNGIHYIKFDNSIDEIRLEIIEELKEAGYKIG